MNLIIGFVGLTHLGFTYTLACSKKGFKVKAFDFDRKLIAELNKGNLHIKEPNAEKILKKNKEKIEFTSDIKKLLKCNIIFFSYDTPTNNNLKSNFFFIKKKINQTLRYIPKKSYFIILSQAIPGFSKKIDFPKNRLIYQVETLIFGKAIERALKPERIILGFSKNKLPTTIRKFYRNFSENLVLTNYETAELSKLAINLYLSSMVSTTNTINELAIKLNANWSDLKDILKLDRRIGKYAYLNPGLGLSGGNLERDHINFINLSKRYKTNSSVINSYLVNSNYHKIIFLKKILKEVPVNYKILIYGLTYKENTHSIKNSISLDIIEKFYTKNNIFFYDKNLSNLKNEKILKIKSFDFNKKVVEKIQYIIFLHKPQNKHVSIILQNIDLKKKYYIFDPFGYIKDYYFDSLLKKSNYFSLL